MKKAGIFLILAGLLCILAFVLYNIISVPEIPLLVKFGVSSAIVGLIIVTLALILERSNRKKGSEEDDLSKY